MPRLLECKRVVSRSWYIISRMREPSDLHAKHLLRQKLDLNLFEALASQSSGVTHRACAMGTAISHRLLCEVVQHGPIVLLCAYLANAHVPMLCVSWSACLRFLCTQISLPMSVLVGRKDLALVATHTCRQDIRLHLLKTHLCR